MHFLLQTDLLQDFLRACHQISFIIDIFQCKQDFLINPAHTELIVGILEENGHSL